MGYPITIESRTDPSTGTRRLDLWGEDATGGAYCDDARGTAYSSRYLSDAEGDGLCAEIAVYPIEEDDGLFAVEQMTTIGWAECEDGLWRPDDSADIDYDGATDFSYETLEDAQKVADRVGREDISYALNLRPRTSEKGN